MANFFTTDRANKPFNSEDYQQRGGTKPPTATATPAPTVQPPALRVQTGTPLPTRKGHTVKQGDTLSAIAARNKMKLEDLLDLNPKYKSNPNLIKPGEQLYLSKADTEEATSPTSTSKPVKGKAKVKQPTPKVASAASKQNFPDSSAAASPDHTEGMRATEDSPNKVSIPSATTTSTPSTSTPTKKSTNVPVDRNIGVAGKGMFDDYLNMPDADFEKEKPKLVHGRDADADRPYNNKVLQSMSDFMAANPDVNKISRKDAKGLSDLVKQNKINPDSDDDETRRMRKQFINWSGISSFE
jgi:LysM repeat protein